MRPTCKPLKKFPALAQPYGERVFFQDEMRFGTRTELKRKWTPQGHRPKAPICIGYAFAYLYVALCPFSGEIFAMSLPYLSKECFQWFIQQWQQTLTEPTLLVADQASTHQESLLKGTYITLQHLPTACPELNPIERFFKNSARKWPTMSLIPSNKPKLVLSRPSKSSWMNPQR